jgi:hypothetical protein
VLGDLLTKKPGTKKVENFFTVQINTKLESLRLDARIKKSFDAINSRFNNRMGQLRQYLDQFDFEN